MLKPVGVLDTPDTCVVTRYVVVLSTVKPVTATTFPFPPVVVTTTSEDSKPLTGRSKVNVNVLVAEEVVPPLAMPSVEVKVGTESKHNPYACWQLEPQWSAVTPQKPKRLQQEPEAQV